MIDTRIIVPLAGSPNPTVFTVDIEASRLTGVSPATFVFSCKNSSLAGYNEHEMLGCDGLNNVGYYFNFGDPSSGTFNTFYATEKNISVGGFMGIHTYEVADGNGSVEFTIKVNAEAANGAKGSAQTTVTVQAQDDFYSAANTIAVSNTLGAGGWDALGNTRNPPTGYAEETTLAAVTASGDMFWNDIQGKRILLYRGDDFSAEGPIYIRSGNDDFELSWFGDEFSGTVVTESGSTISFVTPTEANKTTGIGGTINDSANGLGSLLVNAEIDITGAAGNNRTWKVRSVSADSVTVRYDKGAVMTTESANGASVITEHSLKPVVDLITIGNRDTDDTSTVMNDADLATAVTDFGNDGWCANGYFDGLRTRKVAFGFNAEQITCHKLDLDMEDEGSGIGDNGRITLPDSYGNVYNPSTVLDPDSAAFPKGLYFSECVIIGSQASIDIAGGPNINLSGVQYTQPIWSGMVGCVMRKAQEHNFRIQGYQNFIIHDCDALGQHIGGAGQKSRFAIRGAGLNQVPELTTASRRGDFTQTDVVKLFPFSRWIVAQYLFSSASSTGESSFAGAFQTSSGSGFEQLHMDALWHRHTIDPTSSETPTTQLIVEVTKYATVTQVTGYQSTGWEDKNAAHPVDDGPDNVVINGVVSTEADYLTPNYLSPVVSPGTYNLPVPEAPVANIQTENIFLRMQDPDPDTPAIETYNFTGTAQCALLFRGGHHALNAVFDNKHIGVGFWDTTNYAMTGDMLDPEAGGAGTDGFRTHSANSILGVNQSTGNQGVVLRCDVQSNNVDSLVLEHTDGVVGNWDFETATVLVPFLNGVANSKTGSIDLGNAGAAIPLSLGFEPHVIFFTSIFTDRTPESVDAEPTASKSVRDSNFGFGCAANITGSPQRVMTWCSPDGVLTHDASTQLRDDACMAKTTIGGTTVEYTVDCGGYNSDGAVIQSSAAAGNEILQYHAIRFDAIPNLKLVNTSIPTSGDWTQTGIGFTPKQVIGTIMPGATSRNAAQQVNYSGGFVLFNGTDGFTIAGAEENLATVSAITANVSAWSDIRAVFMVSEVSTYHLIAPIPTMNSDGWTTTPTTNTLANPALGWSLVIG